MPADPIVESVWINAMPERVFEALTDAKQLDAWWGSEPTCLYQRWSIDARLGGSWRCEGNDTGCGDYVTSGEIVQFEPPHVLSLSWREDRPSGERLAGTLVEYKLAEENGGTRLTVRHSGFADEFAPVRHEYAGGWPGVLKLLEKSLADSQTRLRLGV